MTDTNSADDADASWFARAMWDDLPEDAKNRLRESRSESTEASHD